MNVSKLLRSTVLSIFISISINNCARNPYDAPVQTFGLEKSHLFDQQNSGGDDCKETVQFAWDANPEGNIVNYTLHTTDQDSGTTTDTDAGNSTTKSVDLSPGSYSTTVTATNSFGKTSDPSNPVTFTVKDDCGQGDATGDTYVTTSDVSYDPNKHELSANFKSASNVCPNQLWGIEKSTDLTSWTDTGDVLISPFDQAITLDSEGAPSMYMRTKKLPGDDGTTNVETEPCDGSGSGSGSGSGYSSESSSYGSGSGSGY